MVEQTLVTITGISAHQVLTICLYEATLAAGAKPTVEGINTDHVSLTGHEKREPLVKQPYGESIDGQRSSFLRNGMGSHGSCLTERPALKVPLDRTWNTKIEEGKRRCIRDFLTA